MPSTRDTTPTTGHAPTPEGDRARDVRDTPAMRQYARFKRLHPGALLLFRMGDFYEMFDDDARLAHRILGVTLTQRTAGVPMAGVPFHAIDGYLRRLLEAGVQVAVCDQIEDPRHAKGIVERAVTRVLTPGALVDESLLREDRPNHLAALAFLDSGEDPASPVALAIADLSTGEFVVTECAAAALDAELARRGVSEALYAETADAQVPPRVRAALRAAEASGSRCIATARPAWHFRAAESLETLLAHFAVRTLAGFGLRDDEPAVRAAGALLRYLRETQAPGDAPAAAGPRALAHLRPPRRERADDHVALDAASLRALEIERTLRPNAPALPGARGDDADHAAFDGSLLGVFLGSGRGAGCRTPMGKRLLRDWLCRPSADLDAIRRRHDGVGAMASGARLCEEVGELLGQVQDVPRIAARASLGRATPRDVAALGRSLRQAGALALALEHAAPFAHLRERLEAARDALGALAEEIDAACVDAPPPHLREGGLFLDGVDPELDEARRLQHDAGSWLAEYQTRLAAETGLALKVGYNRVFGYYIEITAAQARRGAPPPSFERSQTLKNAERYTTRELRDFEAKVTSARERALDRERALFDALCARVAAVAPDVARFAAVAAELDALRCLGAHAARFGWTRPDMRDEPVLRIVDGRHPVLERTLAGSFVPNGCELGDSAPALALITGPNMAGKSTYIRQTALIVLLAHAGSFVPAAHAEIGRTDRVCTRIGADDALHAGQSTFMVEMIETASILHHATARSLVILDEIGRGTSTLDGLALAWAIAERLAGAGDHPAPRTLFATHYHELTQLEDALPGRVRNLQVAVREWPAGGAPLSPDAPAAAPTSEIVFLHRIVPGRADRSYGVHVARLAGLPADVVARAREVLDSLAVSHEPARPPPAPQGHGLRLTRDNEPPPTPRPRSRRRPDDLPLFTPIDAAPSEIEDELRAVDLNAMTPMQAFDLIRKWRERLK